MAGAGLGALALVVVAVVAATSSTTPTAPQTSQVTPTTSEPPAKPEPMGAEQYQALADKEAVETRRLVESGKFDVALTRLSRLIERWKGQPAAQDGVEQLESLLLWVKDTQALARPAEPEPAPKKTPSTPAPTRQEEEEEEEEPDEEPAPRRPTPPPARPDDSPPPAPPPRPPERPAPTPPAPSPTPAPSPAPAPSTPAPVASGPGALDPDYQTRRAATAVDAEALYRLARWAEKEDLFEEEKDALVSALHVDPEHKKAKERLAEVLAEERRHSDYHTPWRRDAPVLFVETNTNQALLHYYCDSVTAFYGRFSKVFRVAQSPVQKWGTKIGVKIFASREDFNSYRRESSGSTGESVVGFYSLKKKELVLYHDPNDVDETLNTMFHEGTHLFSHLALGDAFHDLPIWISEGIAEYFGTARFDRAKKDIEYGQVAYGRLGEARRALARQNISLRADVVGYTDYPSFGSARYALSWALVHMLIEKCRPGSDKPIYRDRFVRYFDAVSQRNTDPVQAFEQHIGPIRALEEEWKAYIAEIPLPPYEEALAALRARDYPTAITLLEEHRRQHPDDPKGAYYLGEAFNFLERMDEAVAAYRAAVALSPRYEDAWSALGWALLGADDAEALAAAQQAVAIRPSGENQMLVATAAMGAGQKRVAQVAIREAIELLGPLEALRRLEARINAM
jgi:tetratricopeptide (TPR) repeat protein